MDADLISFTETILLPECEELQTSEYATDEFIFETIHSQAINDEQIILILPANNEKAQAEELPECNNLKTQECVTDKANSKETLQSSQPINDEQLIIPENNNKSPTEECHDAVFESVMVQAIDEQANIKKDSRKPYTAKRELLSEEVKYFLSNMESFFVSPSSSLQRKDLPLTSSTMTKNLQRLLGFIGFKLNAGREKEFVVTSFEDNNLIEEYVEFLRSVRQVCNSTIVNHVVALTYAIKYLHREKAPHYKDLTHLELCRDLMRYLNKEDLRKKRLMSDELLLDGKWLKWENILEAIKTFEDQSYGKKRNEVSTSSRITCFP